MKERATQKGDALGELKVVTENAWFAARPSGTENVYNIVGESFGGEDNLLEAQSAAKAPVDEVFNRITRRGKTIVSIFQMD